jgi:hypothetical protein
MLPLSWQEGRNAFHDPKRRAAPQLRVRFADVCAADRPRGLSVLRRVPFDIGRV